MHVPTTSATPRVDLQALIQALADSSPDDGMQPALAAPQWEVLAPYLQPVHLAAGQVLFAQGSMDRSLYLVESGNLSVHYEDAKQRLRLAIVGAGSVVGEGAFFSQRPRSATVQAGAPTKLWCLTHLRFTELSNRQPAIALLLVMAASAVLAKRLANRRRRVAAT